MAHRENKRETNQLLYVKAYQQLLEIITSIQPGGKLPSETALTEELGLSRNTLRQALQVLQEDGVIHRKQGSGTYISEIAPMLSTTNLNSYAPPRKFLQNCGITPDLFDLKITMEESDEVCSKMLNIENGSSIIVIHRMYGVQKSNEIFLLSLDFIPITIIQDSLLLPKEAIAEKVDLMGASSICRVIPTIAGTFLSTSFHIPANNPILLFLQLVVNAKGESSYLNKTYINTDRLPLPVSLNRH